ncbi:hypothetical protein QR680_013706 [Steinernema hermaphroditum]|uniref:Uncharacterized protein n=1 Tax=Steinernema hermaphroditum TaxID=289476 RepID=A0AA39I908_9BILA|nr:hypothetical protein QR680_013706 [Steinernema hermaphroditum]
MPAARGRPRFGPDDPRDPNRGNKHVVKTRLKARERRENEKKMLEVAQRCSEQLELMKSENGHLQRRIRQMYETMKGMEAFHDQQMKVFRDKNAALLNENATLRRKVASLEAAHEHPPQFDRM